MEFKLPSRNEKRKGVKYNSTQECLTLLKSQEYSEFQALGLYLFQKDYPNIAVFLPKYFIEDVRKKNKHLHISRKDYQIVWICDGKGSGKLEFPKQLREFIKEHKNKIMIISLHFWSCSRMNGGHANVLVYY